MQMDMFCSDCLVDPSLLAVYFSDDTAIYYKRCLDTLRKKNFSLVHVIAAPARLRESVLGFGLYVLEVFFMLYAMILLISI